MNQGKHSTDRSSEKLVLAALKKNGSISGVQALADMSHRRLLDTNSEDIKLVKGVADAVKRLEEKGLVKIERTQGGVTFELIEKQSTALTQQVQTTSFDFTSKGRAGRAGVVVGLAGAATMVAGCSYLVKKEEPKQAYAPQPVMVSMMVQEKSTEGSNYWTVCQGDCPQPTVKTYAPIKPVEAPVEKLVLKMEEELKSLYYLAFFRLGSAELGPYARQSISKMVGEAKKAKLIVITGRTDESGPVTLNLNLAQQRAEAVKAALIKAGVTAHIEIKTEIKPNSDLPKDAIAAKVPDNNSGKARRAEVEIQIKQPKTVGNVAKK